jgi:hypothetical protein
VRLGAVLLDVLDVLDGGIAGCVCQPEAQLCTYGKYCALASQ